MGVQLHALWVSFVRRSAGHLLSPCDEFESCKCQQHGSTLTTSILSPDSSIPADGEYDVLANAITSAFAGTFASTFTYSGTGTPSAQSFTLYDSSFAPITAGTTTTSASSTAVTPEPSSFSLLASGIVVFSIGLFLRRHRTQPHLKAVFGLTLLALFLPGASHAQGVTPPGGTGGGGTGGGGTGGGGTGGGGTTTSGSALTGFTIGAYTLQSSYRVSTYQYNYTYTTTAANATSTPYNLVLGTLTSSNANTTVVSGSVEFGLVPAAGSASGLTTFTIRQDRRYAFDPTSLSWSFTGTSTTSVGTTASSVLLNASPTSTSYGSGVTLTATVPSAGTGTITFFDGPVPIGTASPSSGSATLSGFVLPTGTHNLSAAYSGDTTYAASSSSVDPVTITAAGAVSNCSGLAETPLVVCLTNAFEATLTTAQLSTVQLSYTLAHAEQWSNLPGVTRNGLAFSSLTSTQLAAGFATGRGGNKCAGIPAHPEYPGRRQRIERLRGKPLRLRQLLHRCAGKPLHKFAMATSDWRSSPRLQSHLQWKLCKFNAVLYRNRAHHLQRRRNALHAAGDPAFCSLCFDEIRLREHLCPAQRNLRRCA